MSSKKFKELLAGKEKYQKEKAELEEQRLQNLANRISFDLKQLPNPLPTDFETFEKSLICSKKEKEQKSQKKGLGFGIGQRIPLTDKEKWVLKVERYNINKVEKIDPSVDNCPGPLAYSLIANWPGKISKKDKEGNKKLPNIFKVASTGPSINPYYVNL